MTVIDFANRENRMFHLWRAGGSSLPLLKFLLECDRKDEAAVCARLALVDPSCEDRKQVEAILSEIASPPDGWTQALLDFSENPSVEAWETLMQFTPPSVFYQRTRYTLTLLQRMGTNPNILFRCATRYGTTPDAIELVESGAVDPQVVASRADEVPIAAGFWLGLAAQAALARDDRFGVLRYLKQAYARSNPEYPPDISAMTIREHADEELHEQLDKIGVPRANDFN